MQRCERRGGNNNNNNNKKTKIIPDFAQEPDNTPQDIGTTMVRSKTRHWEASLLGAHRQNTSEEQKLWKINGWNLSFIPPLEKEKIIFQGPSFSGSSC